MFSSGRDLTGRDVNFDATALRRVLFDTLKLPPEASLAVAYSGGLDSHVLLHALCELRAVRAEAGLNLTALHFDHGMAAQSAHWAVQCAAVCREWEVAYLSHRQTVRKQAGESLEAQARSCRYGWFAHALAPGQILLTAHQADDQAETVLLNLLRGGGVESLAGIALRRRMSPQRISQQQGALIMRPLLGFSRRSLHDYADRHGLGWIEDPSNQSAEFDRNFIRQSLFPVLRQRWPGAAASLARAAENCRETAGFLGEVLEPNLQRCQAAQKRGVFCVAPPLDVRVMKTFGRFQIIALIRAWIHRHGRRSPSSGQLDTLYRQVFADDGLSNSARAGLRWDESELRYFAGHLYLTRRLTDAPADAVEWALPERDLQQPYSRQHDLGGNGLRIETQHGAGGDIDPRRLRGKALQLVWRNGGERMTLRMTLPKRAHSSALKKLFQQHAVPPWERRAVPLLVADGEVAWAHGIGPGALCCVQDDDAPAIRLRFVCRGD